MTDWMSDWVYDVRIQNQQTSAAAAHIQRENGFIFHLKNKFAVYGIKLHTMCIFISHLSTSQPMRRALNFNHHFGWESDPNYPIAITNWWFGNDKKMAEKGKNGWDASSYEYELLVQKCLLLFASPCLRARYVVHPSIFLYFILYSMFVYFLWSMMTYDDSNTFQTCLPCTFCYW